MLKAHLDLTKGNVLIATLTWHAIGEDGQMQDIGFDFTGDIDEGMRQRIIEVCSQPIVLRENGVATGRAQPGSSKHFENLPKYLERLGCRVRAYY